MIALLILSTVLQPVVPVTLAGEVYLASPLDSTTILFSTTSGTLLTADVTTGAIEPWNLSWSPDDYGWVSDGAVYDISVSPDGQWVCVAKAVYLPENYALPEDLYGMRSAFIGIIAKRDGSEAWPAFMGVAAGGGPEYAFTEDSRLLLGSPMFPCEPTPEGYSLFAKSEWNKPPVEPFNSIRIPTGERIMLEFPDISDGFWKCPYSDYFRVENNWYEVHNLASFREPEILSSWETPAGRNSRFLGWVLPDAVLLTVGQSQLLLFVDGTEREVEFPFQMIPEAWLPDGSYLYTEDSDTEQLHHAEINWDTCEISELGVFYLPVEMEGQRLVPMPGSRGVFCVDAWETGNLYYIELPFE
jgi:hypothetical protein